MNQATPNKSRNRNFCKPQPLRTLAELTAFVSHRLPLNKLPTGQASSSKEIVVKVSQESAARLGASFNGRAPIRMVWMVWWIPSAIGHLQGGCAARSRQMLVTVSRVLTPHQGVGLNGTEIVRPPDGHEVGLAAGQA